MSKISVIVPVYNTAKYLERCMNSILSQTMRDLEIILIDDGSTDQSPRLCDDYAEKDSRVKVIHKTNGGLSSARNAGIETASSNYIGFVDSDDYISANMYEILYVAACEYNADITRVNYKEVMVSDFKEKASVKRGKVKVFSGNAVEESFHDMRVESVCVGLYKKEVIGSIRFPVGKTSEDIPFNFSVFRRAKIVCFIPKEKYFYFNNPSSISNGKMGGHQITYIGYREEIYHSYNAGERKLRRKAKLLCARAYMAVLLRIAMFGTKEGFDENTYAIKYQKKLRKAIVLLLFSLHIPISRKVAAILLCVNYPFTKFILRSFLNDKIIG